MSEPTNLLLVDDNIRNLDALEAILAGPHLHLVRATNADEALLALVRHDFAAIVLDVQMPGIGGVELAEMIKARKKTRHVPILFLTAHFRDDHDVLRGYGAGAVDYLTKPVNPDILRSKVAVFVDLHVKTRALAELNLAMEDEIRQRRAVEERLRLATQGLERRVAERTASLRASLEEKDVLLREVHHRVKNNMQVVSSLLSLQASGLPEHLVVPLREARDRVHAIALVHEKLYQSAGVAQLDAGEYVRSLLQPLLHAYGDVVARIALRVEVTPVPLAMDAAVPCGLILNELVTNALKHAFPDGAEGDILVQVHGDDDGRTHLRVRDSGVGLPADIGGQQPTSSLGLRLVRMLTQQLRGQLEIMREGGLEFHVSFGGLAHAAGPDARDTGAAVHVALP